MMTGGAPTYVATGTDAAGVSCPSTWRKAAASAAAALIAPTCRYERRAARASASTNPAYRISAGAAERDAVGRRASPSAPRLSAMTRESCVGVSPTCPNE